MSDAASRLSPSGSVTKNLFKEEDTSFSLKPARLARSSSKRGQKPPKKMFDSKPRAEPANDQTRSYQELMKAAKVLKLESRRNRNNSSAHVGSDNLNL